MPLAASNLHILGGGSLFLYRVIQLDPGSVVDVAVTGSASGLGEVAVGVPLCRTAAVGVVVLRSSPSLLSGRGFHSPVARPLLGGYRAEAGSVDLLPQMRRFPQSYASRKMPCTWQSHVRDQAPSSSASDGSAALLSCRPFGPGPLALPQTLSAHCAFVAGGGCTSSKRQIGHLQAPG